MQFQYALEGQAPKDIGPVYDATIVSDECGGHLAHGAFTGSFVGVACSDMNGLVLPATFDYIIYRPVKYKTDRYDI